MIKLLIYDLDGTLIDSSRDIANSVNWTLKKLGFRELPLKQISSFIGQGVRNLMKVSLREGSLDGREPVGKFLERAIKLYRVRYAEHLLDETRLFDSVREVLEHFKDRKQAVITNKPEDFSHQILRSLGVDSYFFRVIGEPRTTALQPSHRGRTLRVDDPRSSPPSQAGLPVVRGEDQVFPKKPSPESVLDVMRSARALPQETVLVGDSEIDIQTGKNAGVKTIAVTYGLSDRAELERARPDYILNHASELISCPLLDQV